MKRFVGLMPFDIDRHELFFARDEETQRLAWHLVNDKVVIVHGMEGVGKTSLIRCGLAAFLKAKDNYQLVYFSLDGADPATVIPGLRSRILLQDRVVTYLDKVADDDQSLWFALRKYQALHPDSHVIIAIDDAHLLLNFPRENKETFLRQVADVLYSQVPVAIKEQIDSRLQQDPGLLTPEGYRMLYSDLKVSFVFSLDTNFLSRFLEFKQFVSGIGDNVFEIEPFDRSKAGLVLSNTAAAQIEGLGSQPFEISGSLTNNILDFLTTLRESYILPAHVQIIGMELEKLASKKSLVSLTDQDVPDPGSLFVGSYLSVFEGLDDLLVVNLRRLVEEDMVFEPEHRALPVYVETAKKRYSLTDNDLQILVDAGLVRRISTADGKPYLMLASQALVDVVVMAREQRLEYEIRLEQEIKKKRELEKLTAEQQHRYKVSRRWLALTAGLLVLSVVLVVILLWQRGRAVRNQRLAQSTLYSALAFQNMDRDPTYAIRLAQKGYQTMPTNPWAWSALLSSFYHTGLFYQQPDTVDFPFTHAHIDPETGKILAIYANAGKSVVYYYNKPMVRQIGFSSVQNFALFLPDSGFVTGGWDSTLHFFHPDARPLKSIKLPGIAWSAAVSNDRRLAVGLSSGLVIVLDTNYNVTRKIKAANSDITALAFSTTGLLAASSQEDMITIFDQKYKLISKIPVYKTFDYQYYYIAPLSFSSDGQYIAAALNDFANNYYVVRVWTVDGNEIVNTRMADQWINDMKFVPGEDAIITASKDGKIRWFDVKTGMVKQFLGHGQSVISVAFSPEKKYLTSISLDRTVRHWLVKPFPGVQLEQLAGYQGFVFSRDGSILCVWRGRHVEAYDLTLHRIGEYELHSGYVKQVRATEAGFLIITSDRQVIVWDPSRGLRRAYSFAFQPVDAVMVDTSLAVCSDTALLVPKSRMLGKGKNFSIDHIISIDLVNKYLCVATANGINLYNRHRQRGVFVDEGVKKAVFRHGNIYVLTKDGKIKVFDYHLRQRKTIVYRQAVEDFDVSQDEVFLLVKHIGGLALVNNNGQVIYDYPVVDQVLSFAFNPNNQFFVAMVHNQRTTSLKHWICSPQQVVNYIDNVHYFGWLPDFDLDHILPQEK